MAYSITYSGGTITVNDGVLNTTTSLSLPGRNYAGYGGPVDQNLVSMLENFASNTSGPSNAIKGQLWFDTINNLLKYNTSGTLGSPTWVTIAGLGNNLGAITATSVTSSGPITGTVITATNNHVYGVADSVTAAGTVQGDATAITKDINVITTAPSGAGVRLPATTPGLRMTIVNEGANSVNVYPASGAQVNSLATNAAYSLAVGARLDFVSTTTTKWYTLNATYS
jgi:hypothetical protein